MIDEKFMKLILKNIFKVKNIYLDKCTFKPIKVTERFLERISRKMGVLKTLNVHNFDTTEGYSLLEMMVDLVKVIMKTQKTLTMKYISFTPLPRYFDKYTLKAELGWSNYDIRNHGYDGIDIYPLL